jgi:hypothetical protein
VVRRALRYTPIKLHLFVFTKINAIPCRFILDNNKAIGDTLGMKNITLIKTPATIQSFTTYEDFSGAPAVISYGRHTFAFDLLGEVKCNLLKPVYGSRVESKIALDVCSKAYRELLATLPAEYRRGNEVMYSK